MFCWVAVLTFLAKLIFDKEVCFLARGSCGVNGEAKGLEMKCRCRQNSTTMTSKSNDRARYAKQR
jgi:hypothetical protein